MQSRFVLLEVTFIIYYMYRLESIKYYLRKNLNIWNRTWKVITAVDRDNDVLDHGRYRAGFLGGSNIEKSRFYSVIHWNFVLDFNLLALLLDK